MIRPEKVDTSLRSEHDEVAQEDCDHDAESLEDGWKALGDNFTDLLVILVLLIILTKAGRIRLRIDQVPQAAQQDQCEDQREHLYTVEQGIAEV